MLLLATLHCLPLFSILLSPPPPHSVYYAPGAGAGGAPKAASAAIEMGAQARPTVSIPVDRPLALGFGHDTNAPMPLLLHYSF